jgi:uncharacterized protein YcfL
MKKILLLLTLFSLFSCSNEPVDPTVPKKKKVTILTTSLTHKIKNNKKN